MYFRIYWLGRIAFLIPVMLFSCVEKELKESKGEISVWITAGDKSSLFHESPGKLAFAEKDTALDVIDVDPVQKYQTIDGFGFTLTGGSAMLIRKRLSPEKRQALLSELFMRDGKNIGVSYLRISIGSSDLDDHAFTYDDMRIGKTDPLIEKFKLRDTKKNLIPVLKEILKINPAVKIMASPWSAPAWMKSNKSLKGGKLMPEFYESYALYFVKYIQEMAKEGIKIDAITLQNEPENPKNNPSMVMTAQEETFFVKDNLGPAFQKANINTKIIIFDHNCDHPNYSISILNDGDAKKYIDGTAFHLYLGKVDALEAVHKAHPDRNVYFTEQWTSGRGDFSDDLSWHTKNLIIGATRNWSKTVLEWNLASDPTMNPHTDQGGCTECLGAVTIGNNFNRNVSYYIIAQASKFVMPGSIRIASSELANIPNVAFIRPDGKRVLIVLNENKVPAKFGIHFMGKTALAALPPKSVGTFIW